MGGFARSYNKEPYYIRRQLTEGAVRAADKRARFVGIEAYEAAGGIVMRDLFQRDDGGWLQDPALLDWLVAEKLAAEADTSAPRAGDGSRPRSIFPTATIPACAASPVDDRAQRRGAGDLRGAARRVRCLEEQYARADELPEEVDTRLGEIEAALEAFERTAGIYDLADIARAGAFVSVDPDGALRIDRGYVRPEDEAPANLPATYRPRNLAGA